MKNVLKLVDLQLQTLSIDAPIKITLEKFNACTMHDALNSFIMSLEHFTTSHDI